MDGLRGEGQGMRGGSDAFAGELVGFQVERQLAAAREATFATRYVERVLDDGHGLAGLLAGKLGDVEADADDFGQQLRFAERRGSPVHCLIIGNTPLPIQEAAIDVGDDADREKAFAGVADRSGVQLVSVQPGEARGFFLQRVHAFLSARFASNPIGAPNAPTQYPFRVVTRRPGWRVRFCPAYVAKSNATIFGAPSTPVTGPMGAGRWIFGLDAAGERLRWDTGEFDVPPATEAVLTVG